MVATAYNTLCLNHPPISLVIGVTNFLVSSRVSDYTAGSRPKRSPPCVISMLFREHETNEVRIIRLLSARSVVQVKQGLVYGLQSPLQSPSSVFAYYLPLLHVVIVA